MHGIELVSINISLISPSLPTLSLISSWQSFTLYTLEVIAFHMESRSKINTDLFSFLPFHIITSGPRLIFPYGLFQYKTGKQSLLLHSVYFTNTSLFWVLIFLKWIFWLRYFFIFFLWNVPLFPSFVHSWITPCKATLISFSYVRRLFMFELSEFIFLELPILFELPSSFKFLNINSWFYFL